MKIRAATKSDSKWILHHRVNMFIDMGKSSEFIKETEELTESFLEDHWTKDYRYFLVEEGDDIVGGCGISQFRVPPQASQRRGVYAYITNMFVEQNHRGRGVGGALLRHVIDLCRHEGIGLLLLHASVVGLTIYESLGFRSSKNLMQLIIS